MASNYTENYRLNQWEAEDAVCRVDFNADNAKIDAAIKAVDRRVDGKAEVSALNSLSSQMSSLSSTVSGHTSALNRRGNCQIALSTYTGTGGESNTISFSRRPLAVFVTGYGGQLFAVQGNTNVLAHGQGRTSANVAAAWSGYSVTLTCPYSGQFDKINAICNADGRSYYVISLFDLS